MVQKGVYMDRHEWADVVEYQNQTFLKKITNYEAWVETYERKSDNDPELIKIIPKLKQGERKRIIIQYHNECCFHTNVEV